jgi:hypothetical protein
MLKPDLIELCALVAHIGEETRDVIHALGYELRQVLCGVTAVCWIVRDYRWCQAMAEGMGAMARPSRESWTQLSEGSRRDAELAWGLVPRGESGNESPCSN